jgi:signal transduction histidine kinase
MTDENDNPIFPFESYSLNVQFNPKWTTNEKREYLKKLIKKMASDYEPITILDENGLVFAKFYYTHSSLIDKFKYFPIIEIFIAISFVSFAYIAFNYLRRSEESKLWVGMAKEAAHQLGTPLSSLLAWIEILQSDSEEQMQKEEILREMGNDLIRLKTISERFSKIGSPPEMKRENLVQLIDEILNYFERRVPHLGKRIELIRNYPQKTIFADVNPVLFSWVIENLLKNSFEAIESKEGFVKITIQQTKRKILIQITDNGRGMTTKQRRSAFLPGFTTKKRGWGIGLTFCKRIIEDYHKSKIYIKETSVGKGTTFAIELPNKFPLFE